LEVTHGLNRKNNAGVKTNQHTNHGNVLKKEKTASVTKDGLSMVLKLELIRKNLISSELSSFLWLLLVLMEREISHVMLHHSMVLIQPQMPTKLASVIRKSNSLTNLSSLPPRLSGSHLNLSLKLKVNSREPLSTPLKY
jgi:hypothetical protein